MQTEIEAKFPDIDADLFRATLSGAGATQAYPERLMRRRNFDYPDHSLEAKGGWIRVRDEGDVVTLAYKQLNDRTLHGTKEISLEVEQFETMAQFLETVGFAQTSYQETKREKWLLDGVEVTIDTWPWIPTFAELEGPTEEAVRGVAAKLSLDWAHALHGSVENIYQMHFDVTELEVDTWPEILFGEMPAEIAAKRK